MIFSQTGPAPAGHEDCGGSLLESDEGKSGTRTSKNRLIMVTDGEARKATITIKDVSGEIPAGYPKWSHTGINTLVAPDGSYTAAYEGHFDDKITAVICPSTSVDITIDIVPEQMGKFNIESKQFQKYLDMVNSVVTKIAEVENPPKLEGKLSGSKCWVDMYNDGQNFGSKVELGGSVSVTCGKIKISKVIPTPVAGVSVRLGGGIEPLTISAGGKFIYDDSKSNPWVASKGEVSGECGVSVLGEAVLGLATDKGDVGVAGSVEGKIGIKFSGTVQGQGHQISTKATIEAGKLMATGTISLRFGWLGEYQVASISHTLIEGETIKSDPFVVYSW